MISSKEFLGRGFVTAPSVFLHAEQESDPDKNNELLEILAVKPSSHHQKL
jgi:hypothetical protein